MGVRKTAEQMNAERRMVKAKRKSQSTAKRSASGFDMQQARKERSKRNHEKIKQQHRQSEIKSAAEYHYQQAANGFTMVTCKRGEDLKQFFGIVKQLKSMLKKDKRQYTWKMEELENCNRFMVCAKPGHTS